MKLILPFNSYQDRARQLGSRRLMNMFPEQMAQPHKAPVSLRRSAGIEDWITLPTAPHRASILHDNLLYAVSGGRLYSVDPDGDYDDLGTISGTEKVRMATNGVELVIVSEPLAWVYDEDGLNQIIDDDFTVRGASDVDCIDSFMIYIEPDSGRAFASEFLDASNVGPLDFATAEAAPDDLIAILVDHRQIFLFGNSSVEIWYNSGAAGFPFLREQNGFLEVGCGAKRSPAKADNTVVWMDEKRIGRRLVDLTAARVTTHAVEQAWHDYDRVDDAYSLVYTQDGHTFWSITFPSAGATWEFDFATNEWHERSSRLPTGQDGAWRVATSTWAYGYNVVGDGRSGKLGRISPLVYQEWGDMQRAEWTYAPIYADGKRVFLKRLQIQVDAGVGLTLGQGSDPKMMLKISKNGGKTFDSLPTRGYGRIGEYRDRVVWSRLGSGDDIVLSAAVSDPVPLTVIDTQAEVEGGRL